MGCGLGKYCHKRKSRKMDKSNPDGQQDTVKATTNGDEMREDSDPQPSDKDHPPSLGYSDLTQQNDTPSVHLSSTQENMEMRGDSDPPPSKDHPTSLSNSDSLQQHSTSPVDLQSNQEDVEMQEDSDPQPSDKDHPPSLGYFDLLQQHDTSPVDLQSTQEDVDMQEDSDPQPSDKDHPPSLSHSDLLQQNGTPPVNLPSTQEDVDMRDDSDSQPAGKDGPTSLRRYSWSNSLQPIDTSPVDPTSNRQYGEDQEARGKITTAARYFLSKAHQFRRYLLSLIRNEQPNQPNEVGVEVQLDHGENLQSSSSHEKDMNEETVSSPTSNSENGYSTSIPMKEGSLKEDGHMSPNESLDEYLQRIEQFVNVDFPKQYTETIDDLPADFLSVCEVAAEAVSEILGPVALSKVARDLKENIVSVAFVGRHKSGKSTLINALLSKRLLPTSRLNGTAMVTTVEHTPGLEAPQLMSSSNKLLAEREEDISEYIEGKNSKIQANEEQKMDTVYTWTLESEGRVLRPSINEKYAQQSEPLMVHIDVQLFASSQSYQKMRLVDTPGHYGSGMNHTACSNVLESSTAFVFAIPYTQLGDSKDVAILDEILKVDPRAISDERLLIVITQHDLRYNAFNAELELNVADVRMHVQKVLGQQLNSLDIENFAIPVSGQWALLANDVQILPNRAGIARKAQEVYEMLQEESNSEVRDEDVVQTLKSASNICKLEARIQQMIEDSSALWKSTRSKFQSTLEQAVKKLQSELESAAIVFLDQRDTKAKLMECLEYIQQVKERLQMDVDQLDEILSKQFSIDIAHPLSRMKNETDDILQHLLHQQESPCISLEDLMLFATKESLPIINNVFKKLECHGTISVMQIFEVLLTQEFETMAEKAKDVLHDGQRKDLEPKLEPAHIGCSQDVENFLLKEWKKEITQSLHSDIEESIPIPRERAAEILFEKNGCICSRLFTAAGDSIVKKLSATAKRNKMKVLEKFCEIYESKLEERKVEDKEVLEKAAQRINFLVNQLRKLQIMYHYFLHYTLEQ